jgi:hypothetical protein
MISLMLSVGTVGVRIQRRSQACSSEISSYLRLARMRSLNCLEEDEGRRCCCKRKNTRPTAWKAGMISRLAVYVLTVFCFLLLLYCYCFCCKWVAWNTTVR